MSMIALFAVVAFNDACRFWTLGSSSEMTSIGMSRGSLADLFRFPQLTFCNGGTHP